MARTSRWQQFSDNFNSVYGTFSDAAQKFETARVMDDDRFTSEGGLGAGLEGSALEAARYRALSDIQSKYGDVEGALATRNSYESLRNTTRENVIGDATQDEVIFQRGVGASELLRGQTNSANASANASNASAANSTSLANERNALLPGRLTNQTLTNTGLGLGNDNQQTQNDAAALAYRLDLDAYDSDLELRNIAVAQANANVDATNANAGLNVAQTDKIIALTPGQVAEQLADLNLTEVQTGRIEALLSGEVALQGQQLLSAISAMGLNEAQTKAVLERLPGQIQAQADVSNASQAATAGVKIDNAQRQLALDADQAAADLRETEAGFVTQISDPAYWRSVGVEGDPTPEQRRDALVGLYQNSNVPVERQMAVVDALNKHGIDQLQNVALETAQGAANALQEGGLAGLVGWYDGVDDGEATSLSVVQGDGGVQLVRTSGSGESAAQDVLYSGANESEIEAQLMAQVTNPGTGMEVAAAILDMRATAAGIGQTGANTRLINAQVFTEMMQVDAVVARTALVEAQTDQVLQEIEAAKGGLGKSQEIAQRGLAQLQSSDAFAILGESDGGRVLQLDAIGDYMRVMRMPGAPPAGVEGSVWMSMSEEEKAAFQ